MLTSSYRRAEFWRYAGIAVNSLALVGFSFAMKVFFQRKNAKKK